MALLFIMCLARGRVGGEWMRRLSLGFTNPVGTRGMWNMCLVAVVWVGVSGQGHVMPVCVVSMDSLCRWQVNVSV